MAAMAPFIAFRVTADGYFLKLKKARGPST